MKNRATVRPRPQRQAMPNPGRRATSWFGGRAFPLGICGLLVIVATGLATWTAVNPAVAPEAVDRLRGIVGPGPVADVEAVVFQVQDALRHFQYAALGKRSQVTRAAPATTFAPTRTFSGTGGAPTPYAPANPATTAEIVGASAPAPTAIAITTPAIAAQSNIWSPFVTTTGGLPVLERAIVSPDPQRPYVQAALVRIDLQYAQLHLVAGTREPVSSVHIARPGRIPSADQTRLLAAFNGGFKAINGQFGMAVDGQTLLPAKDGLATLAIYRDGAIKLGAWGSEIKPTADVTAFRQNCPLLVDNNKITVEAETDDPALWGKTIKNLVATWRSGLGLSADRRYLIYAVGDGLTVPALAQALITAGAARGMQLDINSYWTRFDTYTASGAANAPIAAKLLDRMPGDKSQFLSPDTRDFFYVTLRP